MQSQGDRVFLSRVDWWLALILGMLPFVFFLSILVLLLQEQFSQVPIAMAAMLFYGLLIKGLVWPMTYTITNDRLIVRFGVIALQYELSRITAVYPTRNPMSSPALSLQRLQIECDGSWAKGVMISPLDREGFLETIAARASLRRDGERLVRDA